MTSTQTAVPSPVPTTSAATMVPSTPPPTGSTTSSLESGVVLSAVLSGAFLAAMLTATINIWLARRKSREEELGRLRTTFAEAFAAHSAYKEMPYAIRRRRSDAPAEERVRLSEALRDIQTNLSYHLAWTKIESETAGAAYAELIQELRRTAGAAMHAAWEAPPIETDTAVNISPTVIDLSALQPLETAYIDAVRRHLRALTPWWYR
ncbi:hypothetical protein OHB35_15190 [Streptomyces phaeochromogenes]|uniref:Uncharacterized protein n=1 Tax=Streptomyces phaeochromogenes TaxID=1923 RepID=A0ABZ1H7E7_STRPH|nr:hypothetical protein [Streptomyces phaeochromogenes]WSD14476.1 hypothetical protein OHB35_15190 [Streptomyces phaeochromogenes]